MKLFSIISTLTLGGIILVSCKKKDVEVLPVTLPGNQAFVQVVHASAYANSVAMQLKIDSQRVSSNISYSTPFPSGGLNTGGSNWPNYLATSPGAKRISMSIPKAGTNVDSIVRFSGNFNVDAGKYYSAFIADTGVNTQLVLVENNRTTPDQGTSRFRFINLIPNQAVDLYFDTSKVASNVPFKTMTPDFTLPFNRIGRWTIRPAGAAPTTAAIATQPATNVTAMTIPNQRIYTVYARGYAGTTGTRAPAISLTQN